MFSYFHPVEHLKREQKAWKEKGMIPQLFGDLVTGITPEIATTAWELDYIVLDFETTGLDSKQDRILSIGWVILSDRKIDLASAEHYYINQESLVKPETAVINHITPQMLDDGISIHEAMMAFFEAARGKIVVAHGCIVETRFILQYLKEHYHMPELPLWWVDTMCIEKNMAKARQQQDIDVTLASSRARYGLPEYSCHNALIDAVATAELLMAQCMRLEPKHDVQFGYIYKLSR
ncbi:3'-5' exonuclease [Vibrio gallicus]|uniref:3'-5' exonuclease n=1 Tax=Vibrio gallicus TaxID=190897 RepID=UPI0021C3AB5E|nr:3'-5' exonuclease [Vibrio gallicus]